MRDRRLRPFLREGMRIPEACSAGLSVLPITPRRQDLVLGTRGGRRAAESTDCMNTHTGKAPAASLPWPSGSQHEYLRTARWLLGNLFYG